MSIDNVRLLDNIRHDIHVVIGYLRSNKIIDAYEVLVRLDYYIENLGSASAPEPSDMQPVADGPEKTSVVSSTMGTGDETPLKNAADDGGKADAPDKVERIKKAIERLKKQTEEKYFELNEILILKMERDSKRMRSLSGDVLFTRMD